METVEEQIKRVGADKFPRITQEHIERQIVDELYTRGPGEHVAKGESIEALSCLTICVLVLKNGFTVVGKSACASPDNYNEEIGRRIAREDAVRQIWALEGYQLRTSLMLGGNA